MKTSPNLYFKATPDLFTGTTHRCIPGSARFFPPFFTLWESRMAPDPALPRFAVANDVIILCALTLKPYDFCNMIN
jgi:hypothetical protein